MVVVLCVCLVRARRGRLSAVVRVRRPYAAAADAAAADPACSSEVSGQLRIT